MGIALRNAVIEWEKKKRRKKKGVKMHLAIFCLTRLKTSAYGDAQCLYVAARNEKQARLLAARLYQYTVPPHLKDSIGSLLGVHPLTWRSRELSACKETDQTVNHAGVIRIDIRA